MADAKSLGQLLSSQVLSGAQLALKHLAQQRLDNRLPA
jgi:hypothetical protein